MALPPESARVAILAAPDHAGGSLVAGMLAVRTDAEMAQFLRGEVEGVVAANRWLDPWRSMLKVTVSARP